MAKREVICDTDVIIDYWNIYSSRHSESKNIVENLIGIGSVILSGITKMELIIGATNKSELERINKNLHQFSLTLINDEISQLAIQLLQEYNLSHGLALPDAMIAATSIVTQVELFTYNIKDYKFINGLKLYQP